MTNEQLQALIEQVSLDHFNKAFRHHAWFNARLKTTGGRYHLADHHIDVNPKLMEPEYQEYLIGVIKHELCHYHLHLEGGGYRHRDQDFKQLLHSVEGLRYSPLTFAPKKRIVYECLNCHQIYLRQKAINTQRFCCGKCRGKLVEQV